MISHAKFSPVAPIGLLERLAVDNLVGDYSLVLAHDVLNNPAAYGDLFRRGSRSKQHVVILDNSVIELGKSVTGTMLEAAVEVINPDYIILPDIIGDPIATVNAGLQHFQTFSSLGPELMAVPQGNSFVELQWCTQQLSMIPNVTAFGLPRIVANTIGSRRVFGQIFNLHHTPLQGLPTLHALGNSHNFTDDIMSAKMPGVMGIDSANPLVLGYNGIEMRHRVNIPHIPRNDFWECGHKVSDKRYVMIKDNIHYVRELLSE